MVGAPLLPELLTVLTTAELCERWRCTPRTLERMARDGRIRRVKLRGGVRYPVDEIRRIEGGETRPEPSAAREADADVLPARPSLPRVVERTWYTVCIAHRKGGVAKSTTTWYLARELARVELEEKMPRIRRRDRHGPTPVFRPSDVDSPGNGAQPGLS